jgi:uncharacterized protein
MDQFIIKDNKVSFIKDNLLQAYIEYPNVSKNIVDINHTYVSDSLRGQGIAEKLLIEAYKYIKSRNLKALTSCSYARNYFNKHKEYQDILVEYIRNYLDKDFCDVLKITKDKWEKEVEMDKELSNFIYDFLVRYYLYNNKYCYVGIYNNKIEGFLLSNEFKESNDSLNYFNSNLYKLSKTNQVKAKEYLNYIEYNHSLVKSFMTNNSIYLGLIASNKHNLGAHLIERLKSDAISNNIHELYLWTDETCNYKYYESINAKLLKTYNVELYGVVIKTFIYKIEF